MHSSWRDSKAWEDEGLLMTTGSNEACKLYDAAISQYVGWYDDPILGGLESTCEKLLASDPNFVMGKVVVYGLDLLGTGKSIRTDAKFKKDIDDFIALSGRIPITSREKLHVEAIKSWANGQMRKATDAWESILIEHPEDMLAVKMVHDTYFYLGQSVRIRDSIARVFPRWKQTTPLYGYLHGMFAFGLEETNLYEEALKHARLGLEINRKDAWSTHAYAHVMEMTGQQKSGIKFMMDTETDWKTCGMLACHNYWHLALYNFDLGNYEMVLDIFDNHTGPKYRSATLLDLVDGASLLYRLQLENVNVGDRWDQIYDIGKQHISDNVLSFNDSHLVMMALGSNHHDDVETLLSSMKQLINSCKDHCQATVAKDVGYALCKAFVAYDSANYDEAVDLIYPIRYKIQDIGGSHAQRDVYKLLLINAAIRSTNEQHRKIARCLLAERKALKENSNLTDRLINKAMACHV